MARSIECWVLILKTLMLEPWLYYRVRLDGTVDPTENPKMAMRWFSEEDARAAQDRIGWLWRVQKVVFKGDEPVV
jgi:hypothetical protein